MSAITPALALLRANPVATASAGAIAFFAEGVIQFTGINDHALLNGQRVSLLGRELRMFRMGVEQYSSQDSLSRLVKRIEEIREEADNRQLNAVRQSFGPQMTRSQDGLANRQSDLHQKS